MPEPHVDRSTGLRVFGALQVLAASTKSPRHLNLERNDDRSDDDTSPHTRFS